MLRAAGLPDGKPPPAAIPMLHGAPEKVALIPAAGWLRAPLAHRPKDGGDIDSGKPLARPVYRPDVYARTIWREADAHGLAVWRLGRAGQRHSMHARSGGLLLGWDGIVGAYTGAPILGRRCLDGDRADGLVGGGGPHGMTICRWAGFGQRRRCLNCNSAWKQMILFT